MKSAIAFAVLFLSSLAQAHVEVGTYVGTTDAGTVCSMVAGATTMEGAIAHPLNERVELNVGGDDFKVYHPPVVDAAQSLAWFNHDVFQGVLPTKTGAKALVVEMSHAEGQDGPVAYTLIENNWKTGAKTSVVCKGLKHQN